jgi:signal transduction histidine kinase
MNNFIVTIFSSGNFMPHGHCYLWQPGVLWLHLVSDTLIMLAYYSIPVTLLYFVRKRKDLEFDWMFICFSIFIMACGTTHLMEIWTIWRPVYWLSGIFKAITALASVPTAILLVKLVPLALALPSPTALKNVNDMMSLEIAGREKIENALYQKNNALAALNQELEAFSYSVSHDLRGPLRSMDGFSLALLEDYDDKLDTEGKDALNRIRAASQHMGHLIDDMLRLSQVTRADIRLESIDLSLLVSQIANTIQHEYAGRSVDWVIEDGMTIRADKALMQIAIRNLLENAWKFTGTREKAVIRIGTTKHAGHKAYFIADNGVGFDMAHANRLFGSFQRLHHVADFPGTGIGLAIVQRIIHRHEGEIRAEAKEKEGATFFFNIKETSDEQFHQNHPPG